MTQNGRIYTLDKLMVEQKKDNKEKGKEKVDPKEARGNKKRGF